MKSFPKLSAIYIHVAVLRVHCSCKIIGMISFDISAELYVLSNAQIVGAVRVSRKPTTINLHTRRYNLRCATAIQCPFKGLTYDSTFFFQVRRNVHLFRPANILVNIATTKSCKRKLQ